MFVSIKLQHNINVKESVNSLLLLLLLPLEHITLLLNWLPVSYRIDLEVSDSLNVDWKVVINGGFFFNVLSVAQIHHILRR